jgi:hypothetical protein
LYKVGWQAYDLFWKVLNKFWKSVHQEEERDFNLNKNSTPHEVLENSNAFGVERLRTH